MTRKTTVTQIINLVGYFLLLFIDQNSGKEAEISEFLAILIIFCDRFGQFIFSHSQGNALLERTKVFVAQKQCFFRHNFDAIRFLSGRKFIPFIHCPLLQAPSENRLRELNVTGRNLAKLDSEISFWPSI